MPVILHCHKGIGQGVTGIALLMPQVLSGGHGAIQDLFDHDPQLWFLAALLPHARHHWIGRHAKHRQRRHDSDHWLFRCTNA